jgi:hypothetical protein
MAKRSPTALTLQYLHNLGYICAVVEKRLPIPGKYVTQDIWGFADLLVAKPGNPITLVQTTSRANMSARRKKIEANVYAPIWKRAGGRIWLICWGNSGISVEEL